MPGAHWPSRPWSAEIDDREHRVAPERGVVGHEDDRLATGGDLHRARDDALGVELGPLRRASQRGRAVLLAQPDPDPVAVRLDDEHHCAEPFERGRVEPLGVRARHDAEEQRGAIVGDVARRARGEVVAQRGGPRPGVERLAGGERPCTEATQLVAGAAPEGHRPEQPTRHGHVGAASPPHPAHLEHLAFGDGEHLSARHRRAVDAHLGRGTDHGDVGRSQGARAASHRR